MTTPELDHALEEMKGQQRELGMNALLSAGPALLAILAWWGVRSARRRIILEHAVLEAPDPPEDVIDVDSRPAAEAPLEPVPLDPLPDSGAETRPLREGEGVERDGLERLA